MNKNICADPSCYNFGKYCRRHLTDEPTKQESKEKDYLKIRKEFLKEHPKCEVDKCVKDAKEIHHKKGRTGDLLTDTRYFLAVCSTHHKLIEAKPNWAKENGYSESRLSKAEKKTSC